MNIYARNDVQDTAYRLIRRQIDTCRCGWTWLQVWVERIHTPGELQSSVLRGLCQVSYIFCVREARAFTKSCCAGAAWRSRRACTAPHLTAATTLGEGTSGRDAVRRNSSQMKDQPSPLMRPIIRDAREWFMDWAKHKVDDYRHKR